MNAFEILVLILSVLLGLLLIIGVVIGVLLIKVTIQIRRIADKAEVAADSASRMASSFADNASRVAFSKMALSVIKKANQMRKQSKK